MLAIFTVRNFFVENLNSLGLGFSTTVVILLSPWLSQFTEIVMFAGSLAGALATDPILDKLDLLIPFGLN